MNLFECLRPASVSEAIAAWTPDAASVGGGTNLVDLMKTGAVQPGKVIDLTRLPGLDQLESRPDGSTRIGAMVRNADLAHDAGFAAAFPMVAGALLSGTLGQLRNAATVAGNLVQRTRCACCVDPHSACNRRTPGAGCDAREGDNGGLERVRQKWTPVLSPDTRKNKRLESVWRFCHRQTDSSRSGLERILHRHQPFGFQRSPRGP